MIKELGEEFTDIGISDGYKIIATDQFPTSFSKQGKEIIKITPEGDIFWKGKEIKSDADFKLAMLDLKDYLTGIK